MNRKLYIVPLVLAIMFGIIAAAAATHPARAAGPSVDGCDALNDPAFDGAYRYKDLRDSTWQAGETVIIQASGHSSGQEVSLVMGGIVRAKSTDHPVAILSYTIPADVTYGRIYWTNDSATDQNWLISCIPVPSSGDTSSPVNEPFFETSNPSLSVDAGKAELIPHNGVLPLDVFDATWWGVKTLTATRFPAVTNWTGVEVLCLDSSGNWTSDHVTVWDQQPDYLQVKVSQHGMCGIFPK